MIIFGYDCKRCEMKRREIKSYSNIKLDWKRELIILRECAKRYRATNNVASTFQLENSALSHIIWSIKLGICCSAPRRSSTILPSTRNLNIGIAWMPYSDAMSPCWSTSTWSQECENCFKWADLNLGIIFSFKVNFCLKC